MNRSFEFSAGSLALNFADTIALRDDDPTELLASPEDLRRWFAGANLGDPGNLTAEQLDAACSLRDSIYTALSLAAENREIPKTVAAKLNTAAIQQDLRPQIVNGAKQLRARDFVEAALSTIAADAIEIVATDARLRLRRCPECRMLFRDNSRPGNRIWCSSASGCGNRAKVRRHRAKQKKMGS